MTSAAIPSRRLAIAAAAAALAVVGCGGAKEKAAAPPTPAASPAATVASAPGAISTDLEQEPRIPKSVGEPPAKLVRKDIVTGKGPRAKPGDRLSVQYTGATFSTGEKFDASWDHGAEPLRFPLGAGQVIPGWDMGIPGMRVGGRRELIIPAGLAYGPQGSPPLIGPNETLVFVVDLVKIG